MRARKNNRRKLGETRGSRRAAVIWMLSMALGLGFGALLVISTPPCLTSQAFAVQVLRGEKINLSVTTETNLSALALTNSLVTNYSAATPDASPLPVAAAITNALPTFVTVEGETYRSLSFQELASFPFKVTDEMSSPDANALVATLRVLEQIPAAVKSVNERAVALTGFMLPVKWSAGLVTDFMLLPNTMGCCYGRMPRINDIIIVNTTGKGVKLMKDVPVVVLGTFHVGAVRNNNYLIGIYQMDCERVVEPSALTSK